MQQSAENVRILASKDFPAHFDTALKLFVRVDWGRVFIQRNAKR
jgi:hypothetical protein